MDVYALEDLPIIVERDDVPYKRQRWLLVTRTSPSCRPDPELPAVGRCQHWAPRRTCSKRRAAGSLAARVVGGGRLHARRVDRRRVAYPSARAAQMFGSWRQGARAAPEEALEALAGDGGVRLPAHGGARGHSFVSYTSYKGGCLTRLVRAARGQLAPRSRRTSAKSRLAHFFSATMDRKADSMALAPATLRALLQQSQQRFFAASADVADQGLLLFPSCSP